MQPAITIARTWSDVDMCELMFTVCDGRSAFTCNTYAALGWGAKVAHELESFGGQIYGGIYDLKAGTVGPEFALGAFQARFHFYRPTLLLITTYQQGDFFPYKAGQFADEARLALRTEPALLDRFVRTLKKIDEKDGTEAVLECIRLQYR
jgi:hypothetical protein